MKVCRMNVLLIVVALALCSVGAERRSSENDPRFKKALKKNPSWDLNKDGILTANEVRTVKKRAAKKTNKSEETGSENQKKKSTDKTDSSPSS